MIADSYLKVPYTYGRKTTLILRARVFVSYWIFYAFFIVYLRILFQLQYSYNILIHSSNNYYTNMFKTI